MHEFDVDLGDGRRLHAYDAGRADPNGLTIIWHHGSPNIGLPPVPLLPIATELGIRCVGYDRPGYGGSTARPDRGVATAAGYSVAVADALGVGRFAVMGHSGGGAHALACAALLPERVVGAVSISGLAPYGLSVADGFDWFAGFAQSGANSMRAATQGRAAREAYEGSDDDESGFTPDDEAALGGAWSWFIDVVRPALAAGPAPMVEDDLAGVGDWGFDPAEITVPTLIVHGEADRVVPAAHGRWLARRIPGAELWMQADDGHITVMNAGADALRWLAN
jgi:pimeloyl-ACP methyl ester carboxylesterase